MTTTLQELDEVLSDFADAPLTNDEVQRNAIVNFTLRNASEIRAALELQQGWQPIETAPEEGEFLVYMPNELRRIQAARRTKKIMVIGSNFDFDLTKPTHWMPLPTQPAQGEQP